MPNGGRGADLNCADHQIRVRRRVVVGDVWLGQAVADEPEGEQVAVGSDDLAPDDLVATGLLRPRRGQPGEARMRSGI